MAAPWNRPRGIDPSMEDAPDSVFFEAINHIAKLREILRTRALGNGFSDDDDEFSQGSASMLDVFDPDSYPVGGAGIDSESDSSSIMSYESVASKQSAESVATTIADDNFALVLLQAVPSPRGSFLNDIAGLAVDLKREELDEVLQRLGITLIPEALEMLYKMCICICPGGTEYTRCLMCEANICECCSYDIRENCITGDKLEEPDEANQMPHTQSIVPRRVFAFCSEACSDKIPRKEKLCNCVAHLVGPPDQDILNAHCRTCAFLILSVASQNECVHIQDGKYDKPSAYRCVCGRPADLTVQAMCLICNNDCAIPTRTVSTYFVPLTEPKHLLSRTGTVVELEGSNYW